VSGVKILITIIGFKIQNFQFVFKILLAQTELPQAGI